ncbi:MULTISPECIES: DUF1799 domain-containing protein [unclassified Marinovum]|uniref:DUF1799 domain-containing protein n=1 Tax=unclassified Marinovum TaxID=2647166 RepID=UPI003EDCA9DD
MWAENEAAYHAFLHVSGQWRATSRGLGGTYWIGLDYAAVRAGLELSGIEITPETWTDLRLIEFGALGEMNRER